MYLIDESYCTFGDIDFDYFVHQPGLESKATESVISPCQNLIDVCPQLTYQSIVSTVSEGFLKKYGNKEVWWKNRKITNTFLLNYLKKIWNYDPVFTIFSNFYSQSLLSKIFCVS